MQIHICDTAFHFWTRACRPGLSPGLLTKPQARQWKIPTYEKKTGTATASGKPRPLSSSGPRRWCLANTPTKIWSIAARSTQLLGNREVFAKSLARPMGAKLVARVPRDALPPQRLPGGRHIALCRTQKDAGLHRTRHPGPAQDIDQRWEGNSSLAAGGGA